MPMKNKIMEQRVTSLNTNDDGSKKKSDQVSPNRAQKRSLLKRNGFHPNLMHKAFRKSAKVVLDLLPDDTVVKLNYDRIMKDKNQKSEAYLEFVENFKDKDVTVYQDDAHRGSTLYMLREDEVDEKSKWVFDISDLIYDEDKILSELLAEDGIVLNEKDEIVT